MSTRNADEREVVDLMQEEMHRYKAELMCPLCKVLFFKLIDNRFVLKSVF